MNRQSVEAFNDGMRGLRAGLSDLRESILRKKMMKQQEDQQSLDNQMRQAMYDLQKRSTDASIAGAERDFGFRKDRAAVDDTRYADQTQYSRGRDQLGDQRYTDTTQYSRGRDAVGDQRYQAEFARRGERDQVEDGLKAMEMSIRKKAAQNRGNLSGYITEDLDDEGNVISTRRRVPLGVDGQPAAGTAGPAGPSSPGQVPIFKSPADLLGAVKAGKLSKDDAKALAKKQGWN